LQSKKKYSRIHRWEGVGICSYLLVNFWYTRIAANQSSISALLTNRVGDCFLTIGMFAIIWSFGSNTKMFQVFFNWMVKKNIITLSYRQVRRNSNSSRTSKQPRACIGFAYTTEKVNPNYVTGFCDAESSFIIDMFKQGKKWRLAARFKINLHSVDLPLLYKIQAFFGGIGSITVHGQKASFRVSKLDDIINVIIPHFIKYPLQSAKLIDFLLWQKCVMLIKMKEHLTEDGLHKILSLKSALNLGIPETIKAAFPNITTMVRPIYTGASTPLNPYWVSGFIDGDGSFTVSIDSTTNYVNVRLMVGLNIREDVLIQKLLEFFGGVGIINLSTGQWAVFYTVGNIKDLIGLIVPHFDTDPPLLWKRWGGQLEGNKFSNYLIWREILFLVNSKAHLTQEGSNQVKELRSKLNKYPETHDRGGFNSLSSSDVAESDDINWKSTSSAESDGLNAQSLMTSRQHVSIRGKGFRSYSTKPDINNKGAYLAGLIEGDGHIAVHDKNSKSKKYRPKIIIRFNLADKPLAERLSAILQAGKVISKPSAGHVILQILAKEEVLKIINLINGHMRTPQIEALHRAIRWINENDNSSIACLGLDLSPIDSNSWLAGLTDAHGTFSITVYDRKKNGKVLRTSVQTFFRIELKQNYSREVTVDQGGSYFNILTSIAAFFTVNLYTRTRFAGDKVYYAFMVIAHNSRSHEIVRKYFDAFPLYSSKYLAYKDWCRVQDLHRGKSLSEEDLVKIKAIKAQFNSKRKVFDFSHLDSLTF